MHKMSSGNLVERLCHIGVELSAEKNVDALLELILKESMNIVNCDGGSIYFIEGDKEDRHLVFKFTENRSVSFPFERFVMPLNKKSIAGACAVEKRILNFKSMDETMELIGIQHNTSYDESTGYKTVNMLVLPLQNYEREVVGVLQLINKMEYSESDQDGQDKTIIPFTATDEQIISALASQAAILIERSLLFIAIEKLLDSTIFALVKALDQRDPITAGHSGRVASYSQQLYDYVRQYLRDTYPDVDFSDEGHREIYIAGLLHDVGKIGVPEHLLMKESKLSSAQLDAVENRLRYYKLILQVKEEKGVMPDVEKGILETIDGAIERIRKINTSGFLSDEEEAWIKDFSNQTIMDLNGEQRNFLLPFEIEQLSIKRGNITEAERAKINSHAQMSLDILKGIPWTKDLAHIPEVAGQHHEKLNGMGYPSGLKAANLSLSARVIAIADIYDALTATDRPYKPAVPIEKSLAILSEESERGTLDPVLVKAFQQLIHQEQA